MIVEVKVCDNCKHKNPVTAVECEECGYDLTFTFPQKIDDSMESDKVGFVKDENEKNEVEINNSKWEMISVANDNDRYTIDKPVTVGRDCECFGNQFNTSNYTSRTHAKLRINAGNLEVMDASTNGTFVDERRIPKMEWCTINNGSTVRFADVAFKFRRINSAD